MEKINIVKLLKDCPEGTKLYSLIHGEVELTRVGVEDIYCKLSYLNHEISFYSDGRWVENKGECILFPSKENRDWSTFQRPFKDGDVVFYSNTIAIFKEWGDETLFRTYCTFYTTLSNPTYQFEISRPLFGKGIRREARFATEEEKQKLFKAIRYNGYKWNAETKTLEKLEVNKFDITTLKPFDKVLVRNKSNEVWTANFYSHYDATSDKPFICVGWSEMNEYRYCIPYEVNNELLGTTNNTEEYGSR